MQIKPYAKSHKIFFTLAKKQVRIRERNFLEADRVAGRKLRRQGQSDGDHVRDLRIAADGLAIAEQKNRSPIWRDLDRPRDDGFGQQIVGITALELRSFQAHTHAIGIGGDSERSLSKGTLPLTCESVPICSPHDTERPITIVDRRPSRRCAPRSGDFQTAVVSPAVSKPPFLGQRNFIPITQGAAFMTAKTSPQISRATSKNKRHINPSRN